jgi:asparagine synthase (glutamine-hydrolysing)
LEGVFAFAVADLKQREVTLCRDLFGVKPLFYRTDPRGLLFSSELPPLHSPLLSPLEINPAAVALFFRYQYVPAPYSIYNNIHKLPAAHSMRVDFSGNIISLGRYSDFSFIPQNMTRAGAVDLAERLIAESTEICARQGVPTGVFLSGGIDSTLVAMNAVNILGPELPAFTIAFREEKHSELPYAQTAARHLGVKLHVAYVEEAELETIGNILSYYGEPFGDPSVLPSWRVCRLAKEFCSISMSGDGGDELFGGYARYAAWLRAIQSNHGADALRSLLSLKFKQMRYHLRQLRRCPEKTVQFWHSFFQYFSPSQMAAFLRQPYTRYADDLAPALLDLQGKEQLFSDIDLVQYMDLLTYQADGTLNKLDRTSMQHSLDVRSPLLTPSVLRMALSLPPEHRFTRMEGGKCVLKSILLKHGFDESFVYRRKQGFGIPLKIWFRKGRRARVMLEELLSQHGKELEQFIDVAKARNMLKKHPEKGDMSDKLWQIMVFALWLSHDYGKCSIIRRMSCGIASKDSQWTEK